MQTKTFYQFTSVLVVILLVLETTLVVHAATSAAPAQITANLTFTPVADSYIIQSNPNHNYGSSISLQVDNSPITRSYLRFVVNSLNGSAVQSAKLRVYTNSASMAGFSVSGLANNTWTESKITYTNSPNTGSLINNSKAFISGVWVEVDISSYIKTEGTYNLVLMTTSNANINLGSRETGGKSPQLVVTTASSATPTGTATQTSLPNNTLRRTITPTQPASPVLPTNTPFLPNTPTPTTSLVATSSPVPAASGIHVMRVEYADYANSRGEVSWWEQQMKTSGINMVALAAGRVEWTYFKWAGHEANWSSAVTDTGIDILADDSARYGQWAPINAVIDVYAPNYVSAHPDKAAINVLGQRSPNLVSTAELAHGAFGQMLLDMVGYIAANYPNVSSISITELSYRIDGYGPDDLALYSAATGRTDWPRQSNGQVNIDDPSIGNWRSAVLGEFLGRAAAIAHRYGKQLFMDVGVSYGNLSLMTNNKGTNYNVMLQNVDKIVVWDYFGEDGFPPEYSRDIAAYLTQFGNDRVILSIGLWGASGTTVTSTDFKTAIQTALTGGMPNLWICPGSMMGTDHWQVLIGLWGSH